MKEIWHHRIILLKRVKQVFMLEERKYELWVRKILSVNKRCMRIQREELLLKFQMMKLDVQHLVGIQFKKYLVIRYKLLCIIMLCDGHLRRIIYQRSSRKFKQKESSMHLSRYHTRKVMLCLKEELHVRSQCLYWKAHYIM